MESLSVFINTRREKLGMSSIGLAKRSGVDISIIEDIESGKELFLPVTIRQKLAKVLKCQPAEIQSYERTYNTKMISDDIITDISSFERGGSSLLTFISVYSKRASTNIGE